MKIGTGMIQAHDRYCGKYCKYTECKPRHILGFLWEDADGSSEQKKMLFGAVVVPLFE
jgi:hypothetical protein